MPTTTSTLYSSSSHCTPHKRPLPSTSNSLVWISNGGWNILLVEPYYSWNSFPCSAGFMLWWNPARTCEIFGLLVAIRYLIWRWDFLAFLTLFSLIFSSLWPPWCLFLFLAVLYRLAQNVKIRNIKPPTRGILINIQPAPWSSHARSSLVISSGEPGQKGNTRRMHANCSSPNVFYSLCESSDLFEWSTHHPRFTHNDAQN